MFSQIVIIQKKKDTEEFNRKKVLEIIVLVFIK